MKKTILFVVVAGVIVGGGALLFSNRSIAPVVNEEDEVKQNHQTNVSNSQESLADETVSAIREFTLDASNFKFSETELRVNKGDTVKITLTNSLGFHDWVIDEFNARTNQIKAGETATVELKADKAGSFEYYCSVGEHRELGMRGQLIVQ